jgi:hypothetical protein
MKTVETFSVEFRPGSTNREIPVPGDKWEIEEKPYEIVSVKWHTRDFMVVHARPLF